VQQSCMQLSLTATVTPGSSSFAEALACAAYMYMLLHMLRPAGRLIVVPPGCTRDWDLLWML
jgi:hypothetical protein